MPPRRANMGESDTAVKVLEERLDGFEKRIDERFDSLRVYLDEKFTAITGVTREHEGRITKAESRLSQLEPIAKIAVWIAAAIGVLIVGGIVAVITHQVTLVFH